MLVSQGPIKNGLSVIQVFMSVVSGRGGGGREERKRKTASCWEASQCPLKREIGKKKSNVDEGDACACTRTPADTPAFTIAVFLSRNV